jgi:hypothetical protein
VSFHDHETILEDWTDDVFDLSDGGAVEGALETGFVDIAAADFSEILRVEQTCTIGDQAEVYERGLTGACGYAEVLGVCLRSLGGGGGGRVGQSRARRQIVAVGCGVEVQAVLPLSVCVTFILI